MAIFFGDNNARKVKEIYIGDSNGTAKEVKGVLVGDSNGTAKRIYKACHKDITDITGYSEFDGEIYTPYGAVRDHNITSYSDLAPVSGRQSAVFNGSTYFKQELGVDMSQGGSLTVDGWFYFTSFSSGVNLFLIGGSNITSGEQFTVRCWRGTDSKDGYIGVSAYENTSGFYTRWSASSTLLSLNTWHHIAFEINSAGYNRFAIDGRFHGMNNNDYSKYNWIGATNKLNANTLWIGTPTVSGVNTATANYSPYPFYGYVYDVRVRAGKPYNTTNFTATVDDE